MIKKNMIKYIATGLATLSIVGCDREYVPQNPLIQDNRHNSFSE